MIQRESMVQRKVFAHSRGDVRGELATEERSAHVSSTERGVIFGAYEGSCRLLTPPTLLRIPSVSAVAAGVSPCTRPPIGTCVAALRKNFASFVAPVVPSSAAFAPVTISGAGLGSVEGRRRRLRACNGEEMRRAGPRRVRRSHAPQTSPHTREARARPCSSGCVARTRRLRKPVVVAAANSSFGEGEEEEEEEEEGEGLLPFRLPHPSWKVAPRLSDTPTGKFSCRSLSPS
mmetsp:Transcript_15921/g.52150  ORF Transcript_15921/g.52150 Transcript_15921/m.52150 type:complete len:232 (-) Transcript_15921:281-976(-)